jgi:GH15 family glucan-1,4-alpha-glucosidase
MNRLYQNSLHLMMKHQSQEGAFIASPNFATYQYAWFRDGSFCAHALNQAGYSENAFKFHQWASRIVLRYEPKILKCIEDAHLGKLPEAHLCFHSRFTLEGFEVPGNWGHHQLDGLGTWLWTMGEYLASNPDLLMPAEWRDAASLVYEYLSAMWGFPCSDCWEENETGQHTYTLAAIYAGLEAYAGMFHSTAAQLKAQQVRSFIMQECITDGCFTKSIKPSIAVDANLIGLVYPYQVVDWHNPVFQKTLMRIKTELQTPIGLHRYTRDSYFGGGEWVLLTDWLGCAYAQAGDLENARQIARWTHEQVSPQNELAEQVAHSLFHKEELNNWLNKWGPIASPLLWSHAMYVLLVQSMEGTKELK